MIAIFCNSSAHGSVATDVKANSADKTFIGASREADRVAHLAAEFEQVFVGDGGLFAWGKEKEREECGDPAGNRGLCEGDRQSLYSTLSCRPI